MRIRGKFTKQGKVKFVGHLDTVRLFQRAIKVAGIPIAYSQGFNPHALVYFAMPLSVGVSSQGEYIDIVTSQDVDVEEMQATLNKVLIDEIQITEMYQVADNVEALMSMVAAATYQITLPKNSVGQEFEETFKQVLEGEEILIVKKGKKGYKEVDIKPLVLNYEFVSEEENYVINLKVYAGSKQNLSPELLLKAVLKEQVDQVPYSIERIELFADRDNQLVPFCECERD